MGLIKATLSATATTLHDQWKEIISCQNLNDDILMQAITSDSGVISKGSLIRVLPGQCAIIIQNGKVLDATAEEGDYTFDESTSPSFFSGSFGDVFKQMWQRFTFGGVASDRQTVYYFNTKEIINNKFGTATPIPFQDWSHPVPNQISGGILPLAVKIKCYGKYTFKITDPSLFMKEIAGIAEIYKKEQINEQIRTEVISAFQNVLNELGTEKYKIPVLELPSQTDEIKQILEERIYDQELRKRGINIVTFAVESVSLDEKSEEYINNYILGANVNMQQGTLTGAYAEAVKNAANNQNGAANGFMGIGMMNMAGGGAFGQMVQNVKSDSTKESEKESENKEKQERWTCSNCGHESIGNFCMICGTKKEEIKCEKCSATLTKNAKFCPECGAQREI